MKKSRVNWTSERIDSILNVFFWISYSIFMITSFRLCYTIPSIFSDSSIVRYATKLKNNENFYLYDFHALDSKFEIQKQIARDFLLQPIILFGIIPFLLILLIIFWRMWYLKRKKIKRIWFGKIFTKALKALYPLFGIYGVIITVFSIWGFK